MTNRVGIRCFSPGLSAGGEERKPIRKSSGGIRTDICQDLEFGRVSVAIARQAVDMGSGTMCMQIGTTDVSMVDAKRYILESGWRETVEARLSV